MFPCEGDVTMTAMCESSRVATSRECGLKEKSRAPHAQANAVAPKIVDALRSRTAGVLNRARELRDVRSVRSIGGGVAVTL